MTPPNLDGDQVNRERRRYAEAVAEGLARLTPRTDEEFVGAVQGLSAIMVTIAFKGSGLAYREGIFTELGRAVLDALTEAIAAEHAAAEEAVRRN